jgi:hypothetical protein
MSKRKKGSLKNLAAKSTLAGGSDEVEEILDEIIKHVDQGAKFKTIAADGKQALRDDLRPRVKTKIGKGGDWPKEKPRPLLASSHVGEIAALLTAGSLIPKTILMLAYLLVKNTDEACKGVGGGGAGDWCA